ncbi:ABC transporter substrate-binding protein [Paucibacter sp. TC2R-5]|uniref:ABC transporter substrate-binding protein n=1 Tax=Paucibacter sp. TC2R-5 TaxID=2893555 RepID=UPI0021E4E385|nr:ABC transporter substrate-binding protein [Paucibacter sp. TC2R-5]MCV2361422.1 ABC transporter substrate-binding protein [Paucibacter sp. TC2R-5]
MPKHFRLACFLFCVGAALLPSTLRAAALTIESWRVDDKVLWEEVLIPAFQRKNPGTAVKFVPTAPTEYDAGLQQRLSAGTAGDLITCRPFDASLNLYKKGLLERLDGQGRSQLDDFPASAKLAWQTDDGRETYCMPIASVIHGFFYNKKIFAELNLQPPGTEAEFFKLLDTVKAQGKYTPLALGLADQWETHQVIFNGMGPAYWQGEAGRKGLIAGKKKLTDAEFVDVWALMARLQPYLSKGAATQTNADSQSLFGLGRAAVYPAGSWDIGPIRAQSLDFGAFPPPVPKPGAACHISDHSDIGIGINPRSKNKEEAYKFLTWMASQEFADLYTNKVTGFFSLSNHLVPVLDPVAKQMMDWRKSCASTIRLNAQILNRGRPSLESDFWAVHSLVLAGKLSPAEAASRMQASLNKSGK